MGEWPSRRGARTRLRDDGGRPLQRRAGVLRAGLGGRGRGGAELVRPHRPGSARSRRRRPRCTASRRSGPGTRACRSARRSRWCPTPWWRRRPARRAAGRDEARLRPDDPRDARRAILCGQGLVERGWRGPVLDAVVIDRHFDPEREGRRTLVDLCAHYGIEIEQRARCVGGRDGLHRGAVRAGRALRRAVGVPISPGSTRTRSTGTGSGRESYDAWRLSRGDDPDRSPRLRVARRAGGCCRRPEAPVRLS